MASGDRPPPDLVGKRVVTISTGHRVELPVRLRAQMRGATFAAPFGPVADLLPEGLEPIRATARGHAAVTLLSVEYRDVDVPGLDPYDEFAVVVPAGHDSPAAVPYLSALTRATDGYVWYMPVTTEAARAFGVDVWGYPKVVADITHEDDGSVRETTVTVDDDRFATLEVARPPSFDTEDTGSTYTVENGRLYEVPSRIDADLGGWPFSTEVSVSFGDHPRAAPLRSLDLGPRALGRFVLDGEVYFHRAEPVPVDADPGRRPR
ncbi:acetoacetate decarboxylase family protein [Halobaculum sp. EA56]|uniref:acetoacetate decarboxylase family protein n=1 Tax=Halobaculum sp. EA56 TaxID=3421648 RepID=UPI003EB93C11